MASGGRFPPLDQLATEAGAGPSVVDYLKARALYHIPTLALVAANDVEFDRNVFEPYRKGFTKNGTTHQPVDEDDANVAKAVMCHLWASARLAWQTTMAPPAPSFPPAPPSGAASDPAGASAAVSAAQDDKPPKTFSQWAAQVQAYNSRLLDGQTRKFPEAELVGAEVVLARLWWEHERQAFGPIGLGEILAKRTWTASGELNALARGRQSPDAAFANDGSSLEPRGLVSVIDGATSIGWALILTDWAPEDVVHDFVAWFVRRAKSRPQQIEQLRAFWDGCLWRVAMGMRTGHTFAEVAAELKADRRPT